MSERDFWKCTPRKFCALGEVHSRMNNTEDNSKKGNKVAYIDQIL